MRKIYISCPATSRSGYGDHSRDLIRSFIEIDNSQVTIIDQKWGDCPQNALTAKDIDISSRISQDGKIKEKPDIWVQITVPNEFQPIGKFNIGITAGMETTMVSPEWIDGMNKMDLNIVPSKHSKAVFENTVYDKHDKRTNQKVGTLKVEKPIEVVFEGSDLEVYKKTQDIPETIKKAFSNVKEDFCFLTVGHWLQGDFGHDRKDLGTTIRLFCETFKKKGNKKPALILKTSAAGFSITDKEEMKRKINAVLKACNYSCNVYLLHGDLTDEEMNGLYNHPKVKAMLSMTHGEGYGRPLQEFSITGKPTIASNWSGQTDFLSEYGLMLAGELKQVHQSAVWDKVILKESKWFYADINYTSAVISDVFKNYKKHLERTRKQTKYIKDNFSLAAMNDKLKEVIERNYNIPEKVELNLPKLEKI
tara:strand:+ start:379 stop:1638 length:1260 start_codon:yes stop_codon:yes gene_type:complete